MRSEKSSRNGSESSGSEDEDEGDGNRPEFPVERARGSSLESIVWDSDYQRWCECLIIIFFLKNES